MAPNDKKTEARMQEIYFNSIADTLITEIEKILAIDEDRYGYGSTNVIRYRVIASVIANLKVKPNTADIAYTYAQVENAVDLGLLNLANAPEMPDGK